MKMCKKCGALFPATTDYFYRQRSGRGGLNANCKPCVCETNRQWRVKQGACAVDGCDKPIQGQGHCITHYKQKFFTGQLPRLKTLPYQEWVTYNGLHQRIRLARGLASNYDCHHCGGRALHWSWNHQGEYVTDWVRGYLVKYSLNVADYLPLCPKCHKAFDAKEVEA